jgi:hypothetical protein
MVQSRKVELEVKIEVDIPVDIINNKERLREVENGLIRSISNGLTASISRFWYYATLVLVGTSQRTSFRKN